MRRLLGMGSNRQGRQAVLRSGGSYISAGSSRPDLWQDMGETGIPHTLSLLCRLNKKEALTAISDIMKEQGDKLRASQQAISASTPSAGS